MDTVNEEKFTIEAAYEARMQEEVGVAAGVDNGFYTEEQGINNVDHAIHGKKA